MSNYYPGNNPPSGEMILNMIPQQLTMVNFAAADFAGLDSEGDHLQDTTSASTSSTLVSCASDQAIAVFEVGAMTTGGGIDFTGTLAEEDSTDDLIQFTGTQYGMARFTQPFVLTKGKDLIYYRAAGNTADANTDANIITISYTLINAY